MDPKIKAKILAKEFVNFQTYCPKLTMIKSKNLNFTQLKKKDNSCLSRLKTL